MRVRIIFIAILLIGCKKQSGTLSMDDTAGNTDLVKIYPDNSHIQYFGRIDFSNPKKPAFCYPGVSVKASFEGSSIDLLMKNYPSGTHSNYYNIIIDDKVFSVLKTNTTDTLYQIVRNLSEGIHTVEVFKRTESFVGKSEFLGFQLPKGKRLMALPPKPSRKMEFIGNSITCGYGNEAKDQHQPFEDGTENNYMAFGAITARNLKAEYLTVAYSGKGVYRNYGGSQVDPLPAVYSRIFPDEVSPLWNFQNYIPDVVVVDLGTNDFSQAGTDSALFVSSYEKFLVTIRKNYPAAKIICVVGPMMTDYNPFGEYAWTRIQKYVSYLVNNLSRKGDANIFYFAMTPQGELGYGADYHPTVAQHKYNASELTKFIQAKTGWELSENE